ncbi:hypothetical protein [Nocardioides iriomotensis]|uniref:Uncharacterized protein n=1 Tax=Nocardioides iriomotensis TaxID=715784 RepID=A0A4Q5IV45_9ACTN|nr:hypothetical protein [Nocardioides iriomotensis]RYU09857.1 hypothetical protein ETU37_18620 [Nocardioides iriomotensis]
MSKMDDLRALREARYEQAVARAAGHRVSAPKKEERPVPKSTAVELPEAESLVQLCGHRAISGRTCTREDGHAAKSHRYS